MSRRSFLKTIGAVTAMLAVPFSLFKSKEKPITFEDLESEAKQLDQDFEACTGKSPVTSGELKYPDKVVSVGHDNFTYVTRDGKPTRAILQMLLDTVENHGFQATHFAISHPMMEKIKELIRIKTGGGPEYQRIEFSGVPICGFHAGLIPVKNIEIYFVQEGHRPFLPTERSRARARKIPSEIT